MTVPDALDLATVAIHHSHDVRAWPATATITELQFRPTGVHVEHTKRAGPDRWPDFAVPGWELGGEGLQYTLWIFLSLDHQWHAMGGIQFWGTCEENGGPPEDFAKNWYYDEGRWGRMTGHQPAPGDLVGFMVSAGDARNAGVRSVDERSNVIVIPFPSSGGIYTAPAVGPVDPPGPPVPLPPPLPPESPDVVGALVVRLLTSIDTRLSALERTTATKEDVRALRQDAVEVGTAVAATLLGRR